MRYQITVDCVDPNRLSVFWAEALGYQLQEPPGDFDSWREYWLSVGVPEDELGEEDWHDAIVDPDEGGPRIWFQQVPEPKTIKNRMHFDVMVGGGRAISLDERKARVNAEVERLIGLGATQLRALESPDIDHYFVAMVDPEGNEFDVV